MCKCCTLFSIIFILDCWFPFCINFRFPLLFSMYILAVVSLFNGYSVLIFFWSSFSKVLNALFNLCKINKRRQEQAAENGIIPHLMQFIESDSPLKQYALPLLCDMAHASRNSREQLRAHGGLDVYLGLLEDEVWSVTALDSIAVCLAHDNDNRKVEQALLKKDAVQKLVKFFQRCPEQHFVHILEPFLKIITYVYAFPVHIY